ncbi:RNA polymerase sigma-I factor [Jeotgalibacillus sp. S-D1]|uniref:RNA polymerase sigma-I factor n=1 Tax=Jeotgalibacillus sp. S-D1 TaxID=2552189 RepID=UPI00105A0A5D|nr:RNA polymerase sigma-I factor [Jeotgalibacillus sp. S-D1]TDL35240.1 RNA polymerase sigma-I factor [Jeotgalibacillus sp. S-D1]
MPLLLLLMLNKLTKTLTLEEKVIEIQKGNIELLNEVINDYKPFIKKSVSSVCKRYIYDQDDEYSIGLMAFHEAIMKYEPNKGSSLLAFSDVVISRKIIDFIRKNQREKAVPNLFSGEDSDEGNKASLFELEHAMNNFREQEVAQERKDEIVEYTLSLKKYGLTFQDVVSQSPKHEDARQNAISTALLIADNPIWMDYLKKKKRLPLKQIEKEVSLSRKTLERNRKYIIAIIVLIDGNFDYLQQYMKERFDK